VEIYITDGYATIYKRNASTGVISTIAGNGTLGFTGDGGPATAALLDYAYGIAIDSSANIYIAGGDCRVRKIDMLTGMISTIAGYSRSCGYSGDGYPATMSELNSPQGLVIDENNNIYIADYGNSVIRKINAVTGIINTIAGNGRAGYFGDGLPAILSQLYFPTRVAVDGSGNIYISDFANNRIRKINNISSSVNGLKTSEFSINIFPNPASTECTITFSGTLSNKANISIYDITGRLMLSQPLTSANTTISIIALPPGLYQCRVSDGETTITKKLVVMR